jgi:hypothetical protein
MSRKWKMKYPRESKKIIEESIYMNSCSSKKNKKNIYVNCSSIFILIIFWYIFPYEWFMFFLGYTISKIVQDIFIQINFRNGKWIKNSRHPQTQNQVNQD